MAFQAGSFPEVLQGLLAETKFSFAQRLPAPKASARQADFVIESYVDPTEPLRDDGPFGDHIGPREVRSLKCEVRIHPPFDIRHSAFDIRLLPPPSSRACGTLPAEGVFHNLVFGGIEKSYPMQAAANGECGMKVRAWSPRLRHEVLFRLTVDPLPLLPPGVTIPLHCARGTAARSSAIAGPDCSRTSRVCRPVPRARTP